MRKNIKQYDACIQEMYTNGYSSSYIANYLNVSKPGVICRLRKLGIIRHHKAKNMTVLGYSLKSYDSKIIELYKEGKSLEFIARAINLSRHSVFYRLKVNNIELRKTKGIKHTIRNPTITLDYFINKVTERKDDFDYFLGIFASDGNIYKNCVRIGGIADENIEFLEHWCSFLDNKISIYRKIKNGTGKYYSVVVFKNQDIADLLSNDYGITPNKTFTLELPYINWNVVRGCFDGDGCLVKDKRCNSWKFEIVSASIKFATQLDSFYKKEGLNSHIYKEGNLYKITILKREDIKSVFSNLYKNCSYFLKRKYDKFLPIIQETE